jgi:hypothetical protein
MRLYCKYCKSEIITPRMELPVCPICLNATILLHQPSLVDIQRLETEAEHLHLVKVPRWETLEQWKKRTGKPWHEDCAVYVLVQNKYIREKTFIWRLYPYYATRSFRGNSPIVCATEAGPPPADWRPEE